MAQTRAAHTRRRLLLAAAAGFARHGYAGSSLAHVALQAEVTLGALTFHFPTKDALARAVYEDGAACTRTAVDRALNRSQLPLQNVIDITHEVSRLLRTEPTVRAASRLSRETTRTGTSWHQLWLDEVGRRAARAHAGGDLSESCSAELLSILAGCMLAGTDSPSVHTPAAWGESPDVLAQLWRLVLGSVAAPGRSALLPGGSPD